VGVASHYLVLDSWRKDPSSDLSRGEMRFALMVQGTTGERVIGTSGKLAKIYEMQMGSFDFPILEEVPYALRAAPEARSGLERLSFYHNNSNGDAGPPLLGSAQYPAVGPSAAPPFAPWPHNPYSQLYNSRFTVQIRETGLQSYSDGAGARHNFEFSLVAAAGLGVTPPSRFVARPAGDSTWDTFTFTDPIHDLTSMSLVFRGPDLPLRFQPDVFYGVSLELDTSVFPGPFYYVRAPGHGLLAGDRVFLRGFESGLPSVDAYFNRVEGHVVGGDPSAPGLAYGDPLPDPDVFYLDPAVSGADFAAPPSGALGEVYVAKRRLRIPVVCRGLEPRVTNHMTP
jgi:hypothetical protein